MTDDDTTYAARWSSEINDTYTDPFDAVGTALVVLDGVDEDDVPDAIRRVLAKAAQCLRNGVPATFTAGELDVVRLLMPAHEVHQSGAVRWVREMYGDPDDLPGRTAVR